MGLQAQEFDTGIAYMEHIELQYGDLKKDMWEYQKTVAHSRSARKIDKRRQELINAYADVKEKVAALPDYNGSTAFRDATFQYLEINHSVLVEDYAKIIDLEAIAEQSYNDMEAYFLAHESINEKMNAAYKELEIAQEKFAEENNINLVQGEDKVSLKLAKAGEVNKHTNEVFLILFKSQIQEKLLIDAQNKQDINAIEQNKNALKKAAEEGLKELAAVKAPFDDNSVKNACADLLKFYLAEVNKFQNVTNFFLAQDQFEKIKKTIESKPQSKRTQEDVNQYNAEVKKINTLAENYNKSNQELNKMRAELNDNWSKTVAKFRHTHVP